MFDVLRIAIIEDDREYAQEIREYLERFSAEHDVAVETVLFTDGDQIVENYSGDYDILLMDIELPLLNGMEASEEIRKWRSSSSRIPHSMPSRDTASARWIIF